MLVGFSQINRLTVKTKKECFKSVPDIIFWVKFNDFLSFIYLTQDPTSTSNSALSHQTVLKYKIMQDVGYLGFALFNGVGYYCRY